MKDSGVPEVVTALPIAARSSGFLIAVASYGSTNCDLQTRFSKWIFCW